VQILNDTIGNIPQAAAVLLGSLREYSVALKAPVRWAGNQLSGQRKSVPRCGGATVPELETSIPEQQNRVVTLCYSLMAGSSPYTSLMDR
jgi:hypothetical protein